VRIEVQGTTVVEAKRILIIDDNPDIHEDFRKILGRNARAEELDRLEAEIFTDRRPPGSGPDSLVRERPSRHKYVFEIDSALQGREGVEMVQKALQEGRPYAMAIVDMRMPPGWDGLETIERLFQADPALEICLCTAFSDYTWTEVLDRLGHTDQLLILKKPFDNIEVKQLAHAQVKKWTLARLVDQQMRLLEKTVIERTKGLLAKNEELQQTLDRLQKVQAQLRETDRTAPGAPAVQEPQESAVSATGATPVPDLGRS
jgi:two-component system NtrC family sensor kinase